MGMGYDYLQANPSDKITGITTRYNKGYDMLEDITSAAKQAKEK
jgi:TldD protein